MMLAAAGRAIARQANQAVNSPVAVETADPVWRFARRQEDRRGSSAWNGSHNQILN